MAWNGYGDAKIKDNYRQTPNKATRRLNMQLRKKNETIFFLVGCLERLLNQGRRFIYQLLLKNLLTVLALIRAIISEHINTFYWFQEALFN